MKQTIQIETITDTARLRGVVKAMVEASGGTAHPVLKESALYMFWGALTLALWEPKRDVATSLLQMKLGKRKKNVWEPYANWYGAYTLPDRRRQGHAYRLYAEAEKAAVDAGCRRVKSLAGSVAGLGLHRALHHQCWGLTDGGEIFVDSPLPGHEERYTGLTPPQAPGALMTEAELNRVALEGLRYDKEGR